MIRRVRIGLMPSLDLAFRAAFERACIETCLAGVEFDTPDAARIAQDALRSNGYPMAEIRMFRSVNEYVNHASNWLVLRDGKSTNDRTGVCPSIGH